MDAQLIRTALGTLQSNPEAEEAWLTLESALREPGGDLDVHEAEILLDAARARHSARGEFAAVIRLLDQSTELLRGTAAEHSLLLEKARVQQEELFEGLQALETLRKIQELRPEDAGVTQRIQELETKASQWQTQASTYLAEAEQATDDAYQSAMLMRAVEAEVCFAEAPRWESLLENLERAVRLDAGNGLAAQLWEVACRRTGRYEEAARVLDRVLDRGVDEAVRVRAGVRLARLFQNTLGDEARAAHAYDRVLELAPSQPDAIAFVTDYYSREQRWDELVRVYERQLKDAATDTERLGDMLQVAMLHWKMRGSSADAEPWFARIRKIDPAHDGVLSFYREYKTALEDDAGLVQVLQEAQRALPEGDARQAEIATELARFAETQANAHRAIEQYKSVLRADPDHQEARAQLKSLYKQTQGHNALVELLRQELERTPEEEVESRVRILREIASVYREYVKSDTALVGVLNQIVQLDGKLDEQDVDEVRELVHLYEKLQRHRDVLASKKLLAEIVTDKDEKRALYRQIGRQWLDQFSNVQHAMEAYAALHEVDPTDQEAIERLDELYRKRRAWKELFALYEEQLEAKQGSARIPLLRELAQLAAERLGRMEDALELYREILRIDPTRLDVIDRLEKYAERSKNWAVLAEALEQRLEQMPEDETRLPVLQKLGTVYADHLEDAERAIGTWRRVVEAQPGHPRAMRVLRDTYLKGQRYDELEELYASQNDLEGLAEVLSTAADRAQEPESKIELSYRAARVYEEKLGQASRAIRSYERILALEPRDAKAIELLLPLYEQEEKWARVPALLETLVELAETPEQQVSVLTRLVEVTGQKLADRRGATVHARRAYELAPTDPRAMELFDAASRAAGTWEEMMSALAARLEALPAQAESASSQAAAEESSPAPSAEETPSSSGRKRKKRGKKAPAPEAQESTSTGSELQSAEPVAAEVSDEVAAERREILVRMARVQGEEQGQVAEAIERLKKLGEEFPNHPDLIRLLTSLVSRENRPEDVRWFFAFRAEHAQSPEDKAALLAEHAEYEESSQGEPARALELHQLALTHHPERRESLEAVVRLALLTDQPSVAVAALEQDRDLSDGAARAQKEALLAELYADRLGRPQDALAAAQRALEEGAESGKVISVLARLVEVPEVRGEAARILSELYEQGGNARQEADALRALISETSDPQEKLSIYERLIAVYEEKLGEPGGALSVVLEAARVLPEEISLWDRAQSLAQVAGRPTELAEAYREVVRGNLSPEILADLCRRAADLHEHVLHDAASAVPYWEKLLSVEPDDEPAFLRLKELLTAGERWRELENLYDREIRRLDDESRQIEMLAEVALLAEDIMGDAPRAVGYQERILELDPVSPVALESLDRLLTRLDRKEALLELLDKRVELSAGEEQNQHLVRIGQLALALHQPERSMQAIERVLESDPTSYEARDTAEELLQIGSVRTRAARALEAVYEVRDEIRDLVRVLGVRVEGLRPVEGESLAPEEEQEREDERRDLLRRIATLRDDRLHDDEGSFDVFAELVPLDPLDADLRERLIDTGRRLNRSRVVVEVLLQAAEAADTPALRAEILLQAAPIQSDLLEEPEAAESSYRKVIALREEEPEFALQAAQALESFLVSQNRHEELAENLKLQIALLTDLDRKQALLARLAQLSAEVLGDLPAAIQAWESRLFEQSDDREALTALSELYEKVQRYEDLARVVRERRDLTDSDAERLELTRKLAEIQEVHLEEISAAIDSYQSLVDETGPEAETLAALARLYGKSERYQELSEVYEQQSQVLQEEAERLSALAALGQVRLTRLDDVPGALEAYRQALTIERSQAESREALLRLLSHEDNVTRLEAAEILQPIFEAEGNAEKLLLVVEVQERSSDDVSFQLERLAELVRVAEDSLQDYPRAMGYALRATRLAVEQGELSSWLATLERLAPLAEARKAQVELLESIAADLFDADLQLQVQKRVGSLYRDELGQKEQAMTAFEKALEYQPEDAESLLALEQLYEEASRYADLLQIFERRAEVAESESERKELLFRQARLLAEQLKDPSRAIDTYESIIDQELDATAIAALDQLYAEEKRWQDLISLLQRRLDEGTPDRGALQVQLARVFIEQTEEIDRGLDELEEALSENSQNQTAIAYLEELLEKDWSPEQKARTAALLEPVYRARSNFDRVLQVLHLRLAGSEDLEERRELITRIAQIHEEQREDYAAALEANGLLLAEDLQDTQTMSEMERLAKVAGAEVRLAELYAEQLSAEEPLDEVTAQLSRRAGAIFAANGRQEESLPLLQRALEFTPEDDSLFAEVDAVLRSIRPVEQRIELYRQGLDHRYEPQDRIRLLRVIADLEENAQQNTEAAIAAYREIIEQEEQDESALEALTRLYRKTENWDELAALYQMRIEGAVPVDAVPYRLALADLYADVLARPEAALDELEEIVRELPGQEEAIARLERFRASEEWKERTVEILRAVYENLDEWRHLIQLNEDRFLLAQDPQDKVSILRETAELWEVRGEEPARARRVLSEAFKLTPEDEEVREEIERLVVLTGEWDELAALYSEVVTQNADLVNRREIVQRLAYLYDERLDDPRGALQRFMELYELDNSDLEAILATERLSSLLADWDSLESALRSHVDMVFDDEERREVLVRLGSLRFYTMEDTPGAIEAYERALEISPDNVDICERLIELYEEGEDAGRLVELYLLRVELADDQDVKYSFLTQAATLLETKLGDRPRAIEALNQALEAKPSDARTIVELNRLYREEEMWPELLDNLRLDASTAETEEKRIAVRHEMAQVLSEKLNSFEEALESYAAILEERPEDEPALRAVFELADREEHLRESTTEWLVPVLQRTELSESLVRALELRLSVESEPAVRSQTLQEIAQVEEQKRGRAEAAFSAYLRAFRETPDSTLVLQELDRLAPLVDGYAPYAEALGVQAEECFEPELSRDLWVRLARIEEEKLGRKEQALLAYQKASEQMGDQLELLEALDRLHTELGHTQEVIELLDRRMLLADSDEAQARLLTRQGQLQLDVQKQPEEALNSLRQAVERDFRNEEASALLERLLAEETIFDEVFDILDGVYRERSAGQQLAALHERRVQRASSPEEKLDMRRGLAQVLEEQCQDAPAALRVLLEGVQELPDDSGLIDELERLLPITGAYEEAAQALLRAATSELAPEVARELCQRAAQWLRDFAGKPAEAEQALQRALELAGEEDEILEQLEALQSAPGREADLLVTLRKRAHLSLSEGSKIEFLRRAQLLAQQSQNVALEEELVREILAADEADLDALADLTNLRIRAEDYEETFELLVRRSEMEADGEKIFALRLEAAELAREKLQRLPAAIELFEALFDDEPDNEQVARNLRQAYESAENWDALSRLVERQLEGDLEPAFAAELKVSLARLHLEQLADEDRARSITEEVLDEDPGNEEAFELLGNLYQKASLSEDWAELLQKRIEFFRARGESAQVVAHLRQLAEVYAAQLSDPTRTRETWEQILELEDSLEALEALYQLRIAAEERAAAIELLEKICARLEGSESVVRRLELAELYQAEGRTEEQLQTLAQALTLEPQYEGLRAKLRAEYEKHSRYEELVGLLLEDVGTTESTTGKIDLLREAAEIHWRKRKAPQDAVGLLRQAANLSPEDRELKLELCDALSESGQGEESARVLQEVVESFGGKRAKELADVHRRLATAYLSQGQRELALEELEKAFRIEPGNIAILKQLGELAMEVEDWKKAMQMFRALLLQRLDESPVITKAEVFFRLGQIHERQDEAPKAKQMFERAVQTDPQFELAQQALDRLS